MRRLRGNKGFMSIKINLEKTYDRLSWSLEDLQLPASLISLIMHYISSLSFSNLWNGEKVGNIVPS